MTRRRSGSAGLNFNIRESWQVLRIQFLVIDIRTRRINLQNKLDVSSRQNPPFNWCLPYKSHSFVGTWKPMSTRRSMTETWQFKLTQGQPLSTKPTNHPAPRKSWQRGNAIKSNSDPAHPCSRVSPWSRTFLSHWRKYEFISVKPQSPPFSGNASDYHWQVIYQKISQDQIQNSCPASHFPISLTVLSDSARSDFKVDTI